ncbi:tellurite resistance protein TerC [Galdieria sulphuraria]|uniref:Tellurite resistance protein TerC n=1 Tax=Galdieria sulphuraria TaxID=130081 RepID=M2WX97_GALSU|nr:tellurite resistance protein TerC [Galdieria sulphuraria]EME28655.1 tellurite resistance protein TerC [Galdieria sulphuraria]|eukprot:XP_005705175.1 tellurite resistance protein TerC [Galdieria sulphuraria]
MYFVCMKKCISFIVSSPYLSCLFHRRQKFVYTRHCSGNYAKPWWKSSHIIRVGIVGKHASTQDSKKELLNENESIIQPKVGNRKQEKNAPLVNINREKDDLKRVALFVSLSLALAVVLYTALSTQTAVEYLTAYIIEESLSVDNLFVFLLIFQYFTVPRESQDRILFWGILGATFMRGLMIWSGAELLQHFHFMSLVFGGFLLYSSFQLLFSREESQSKMEDNKIYRIATGWIPLTRDKDVDPNAFFVVRRNQKGQLAWFGTPLLLVLLIIELSDVVFALDSIPAVLSVSNDRLVIYVSNLMAILGLRSLFFVLNDIIDKMRFLKQSLSLVLGFIGCKMSSHQYTICGYILKLAVSNENQL